MCDTKFRPSKTDQGISDEELESRRKAREIEDAREEAERRRLLAKFTSSELWSELHDRMGEEQRQWWRNRGIPDEWQDFWKVGYTERKKFYVGDTEYYSPAYTTPIFDLGWQIKTVHYRLVETPDPKERYRPQYGTHPSAFIARPDLELDTDECFVVEGATKAGVMYVTMNMEIFQVIGVPAMNAWDGMEKRLGAIGRVYVMFDPDSLVRPKNAPNDWTPWPVKFCQAVGKNARLIEPSMKPDDMVTMYGATADTFNAMKKWARPVH